MDYSFKKTAKDSLEKLDKSVSREIIETVSEVAEKGFNHDKVKMIKDRNGDWIYRIKVVREYTNHRIFADYVEGELKILDILHRNKAYEDQYGNG